MSPRGITQCPGYNLVEILLTVVIIGLIASLTMTAIYLTLRDKELNTNTQSSLSDIQNIKSLATSTLGTLPMNYGPAQIFQRFSRMEAVTLPNTQTKFGACDVDGQSTFRLPTGIVVTSVGQQWSPSVAKVGLIDKMTGEEIPDNTPGEAVCVALRGEASSKLNVDAFWVFLPKEGAPILASLPNPTAAAFAFSDSNSGVSLGQEIIWSYNYWTASLQDTWIRMYQTFAEFLGIVHNTSLNNNNATGNTQLLNLLNNAAWYEQVTIVNGTGRIKTVTMDNFVEGLTIGDKPWSQVKAEYITANGSASNKTIMWSYVIGAFNRTSSYTSNMNSLKEVNMVYKDPATGKSYQMNAGFYSPIKISLAPRDAQLNSSQSLLFDIDGPSQSARPFTTSGGLNPTETWLATDRDGDGFWHHGALDGRDVYGDHLGAFSSGYEDLASRYTNDIKTDAQGKRYIALQKLTAYQKRRALADPSHDLKLITADQKILYASDYVSRIYVDYDVVNEVDALQQNRIGQRAGVQYWNGETYSSADQWFKPQTNVASSRYRSNRGS